MHTATLTEKFQIDIPKAFRDDLGLKAGQQLVFVVKGNAIVMIPRRDIKEMRGMFKGANLGNVRDRTERNVMHVVDTCGWMEWLTAGKFKNILRC